MSLTCPIAANAANILNVCSSDECCLSIEDDSSKCYLSIQDAIDNASDGDTVIVHDGIYYENINFQGNAITVKSNNGPGKTIIDGGGNDSVVTFDNQEDENSVLDGFCIQNGLATKGNGGGIYCKSSSPTIAHCTIRDNSTLGISGEGGGIYCYKSSPKLIHCTISSNTADYRGGGIYCYQSSLMITYCTIVDNTAIFGGGIYCYESVPTITNCTISDNTAKGRGGGIYCKSSSPYVVNSIFWDNGSEIYKDSASNPKFCYCNIQDVEYSDSGLGNINAAPLFVDTENDDYRLSAESPCIDSGHPRIYDNDTSISDMGAYGGDGGLASTPIYITVDKERIVGTGNYTSIQDAIDASVTGDRITVYPGTYTENLVMGGKEISLISRDGADSTIIDGNKLGSVIVLTNVGYGGMVQGFTVQKGLSSFGGGILCFGSSPSITDCTIGNNTLGDNGNTADDNGGGIYCNQSSPIITRCTISYNIAGDKTVGGGGGIYCSNSSPTITDCIITNNMVGDKINGIYSKGGGVYCHSSSPTITNCTIESNKADGNGGGIYCSSSSPTIANCSINKNDGIYGGGIYLYSSLPTIDNCTISNNKALWGGGIHSSESSPEITNCTIIGNTGFYNGGGIYFYYFYSDSSSSSQPKIANCRIMGNKADIKGGRGGGISCWDSSPEIINCIIAGNKADGKGGGIFFYKSLPKIINCTISGNMADGKGGGIYFGESPLPTVVNSILWENTGAESPDEIFLENSSISVNYSYIEGGNPNNPGLPYPGHGNIGADPDDDPLFVDPRPASQAPTSEGNYLLQAGSPCIDVGTGKTAKYPDIPSDDIDGDSRPQGAGYDMGADEYFFDCPHDGDVNQDGGITPQDALMAFQYYLGIITLDDCPKYRVDVNNDGSITPADALCIFQKYLGLSSCLDE